MCECRGAILNLYRSPAPGAIVCRRRPGWLVRSGSWGSLALWDLGFGRRHLLDRYGRWSEGISSRGVEAERRVPFFFFFGVVRGLSSFVMHGAESSLSVYKCAYHDLFIAQMCRAESYTYDPRG